MTLAAPEIIKDLRAAIAAGEAQLGILRNALARELAARELERRAKRRAEQRAEREAAAAIEAQFAKPPAPSPTQSKAHPQFFWRDPPE
jgi:hypothetical protein